MTLIFKEQAELTTEEKLELIDICRYAKSVYNEALFYYRQNYFNKNESLGFVKNCSIVKNSENYKMLNSNIAERVVKQASDDFDSFISLSKTMTKNSNLYNIEIPKYLKKNSLYPIIIDSIRSKNNRILVPMSNPYRLKHDKVEIDIPKQLKNKKIKELHIIPENDNFTFKYFYE